MNSRDHSATGITPRPSRKRRKAPVPNVEDVIRTAGSIGALERLAGVPQDAGSRYSFWKPFTHLPPRKALDGGCEELKRLIRLRAAGSVP